MDVRQQVINSFDQEHMCGFSHEIPFKYSNFIVVTVGKDARNFAPERIKDSWKSSPVYNGLWFKQKPQSFAGPAAYHWAIEQGTPLPYDMVQDVKSTARWICTLAPLYGWLVKYVSPLRQHFNSFMFAHMLLGKIPPDSMKFSIQDNPFYAYLYGIKESRTYSMHVSAWPAKHVWGTEEKSKTYTLVCQLASNYLQSTL